MNIDLLKKSVEKKAIIHILIPLFFASILAFLDRVNIAFAATHINADLGFTPKVYGMGAGIFFAGYVLFEVPGSLLAEKWSPSKWIARIMFTWGAVCMLMAFMQNEWHFYILRFLLGACEASLYPVIYASVIPRWFTSETRARAISITLTSLLISAIIGAPLAGWMVDLQLFGLKGWQNLLLLEGGITVLYGFVFLLGIKDDPSSVNWLDKDEKEYLISTLKHEAETKQKAQHFTIAQALINPKVLYLCATYFFWITGFWGFNFWMPTVVQTATEWTSQQVGFFAIVPMTIALIAMVLIGNSASAKKEYRMHVGIPLAIAAVGFFIWAATANTALILLAVVIVAVGTYAPMGTWWSIPTTFLTGAAAAGATGLINSAGNIGGWIGPYTIGWVKETTGSHVAAFYCLAASLALSAILVFCLKKSKAEEAINS